MYWYNYTNVGLLFFIWVIFFSNTKKYLSNRWPWFLFFAFYTLTEFIGLPMEVKGVNNLWLYNISRPLQFLSLILYFTRILEFRKKTSWLILSFSLVLCIIYFVFLRLYEYSSLPDIIFSSVVIIFAMLYFYRLIKYDDYINLSLTEFWYCTSLLIYFGATLCINGSLNFLLENQLEIARKLFYLLVINSIIFYLLILYALLSTGKKYLS